jgi:hypothetical protein
MLSRTANLTIQQLKIDPLRSCLVREVKFLDPLRRFIRSIERKLVTKIIIQIIWKLRDESIKSN